MPAAIEVLTQTRFSMEVLLAMKRNSHGAQNQPCLTKAGLRDPAACLKHLIQGITTSLLLNFK